MIRKGIKLKNDGFQKLVAIEPLPNLECGKYFQITCWLWYVKKTELRD